MFGFGMQIRSAERGRVEEGEEAEGRDKRKDCSHSRKEKKIVG